MRIILTDHTATNLAVRGIDGWKLLETVKFPSLKRKQEDGTIVARRVYEGNILEVVYEEYATKRVIITAYYVT